MGNKTKPFLGSWICAEEFSKLPPIPLFHRDGQPLSNYQHQETLKNYHTWFRKSFYLIKTSESVYHIRITADDYYKLYINGSFVGQGPAPGYYFAYYYNEYDISPYLTDGENSIEVHTYYQGLVNRVWNSGDYRQGMIADILESGSILLSSGTDWEYTVDHAYSGTRTAGYQTQYLEDYDSRIKLSEWKTASEKVVDYTFCSAPVTPVSVYTQQPLSKKETDDCLLYDFGTELTGGLTIEATGKSGDKIRILCGEELLPDGHVRYQMRCNCNYDECWTLDDGKNKLEQYDYKAFRYVELIPDAGVSLQSVSAAVRHYPFPADAASVCSSDSVLNTVFQICKNGVKYGSQEVFVDCPSREKGQYTGDMTITGASHLLLTGDPSLLKKAIKNQVQSLQFTPGMLAVAPGSFMQEIADYSLQFPLSVWRYYLYTGDRVFLKTMVEPCRSLLSYFAAFKRPDGLLEKVDEKWNLVDWPGNLRDNYDFPLTIPIGDGCHNVINAFYVGCVQTVEQIYSELSLDFEPEAEKLKQAYNRCFFRPESGIYVDSEHSSHASLHSNCLPAFFGLVPKGSEGTVAQILLQKGLCCGVYMAYFLLKGLARLGEYDAVYRLLTDQGKNSWYNMVREGGTTCFEAWGKDQKVNTSLCHPWASAPITVLIEDLAGLYPKSPGEEWDFFPRLPKTLEQFSLSVPFPDEILQLHYSNGDFTVSHHKKSNTNEDSEKSRL